MNICTVLLKLVVSILRFISDLLMGNLSEFHYTFFWLCRGDGHEEAMNISVLEIKTYYFRTKWMGDFLHSSQGVGQYKILLGEPKPSSDIFFQKKLPGNLFTSNAHDNHKKIRRTSPISIVPNVYQIDKFKRIIVFAFTLQEVC